MKSDEYDNAVSTITSTTNRAQILSL